MKINKTYRNELMICEFVAKAINKIPTPIIYTVEVIVILTILLFS